MRDLLVTAIVFGTLIMVLKRPHWGIYLWSWLSYMNPHRQAWGFAREMPFAQVTAIVTLLAFLFSKEPRRFPWTPETVVLVIFIVWMLITTFFAFYPSAAWSQWDKVWKIQLMTMVTAMLITDRRRLHVFIWIIALSIGYYGVKGGIFTIVHGGVYRVNGPSGTFFGGNNEMGLALIMTVPLIRFLHLQAQRQWVRAGLVTAMVFSMLASIGSQSRGAFLAMLAMGVFLWLKSRKKVITAFFLIIVVLIVGAIMPQQWWDRMDSIRDYQNDESAMGRINAWYTAVNVAKHHITGGGFEMFQRSTFHLYAPDPWGVHDAHSIYFEILGEHGFIGLGLFLLLGLLAWRTGSRIIRECKTDPKRRWAADLAAMTQVSMVGYAAGGAFLGLAYFDLYYHLVILMVLGDQIAVKNAWAQAQDNSPDRANDPRRALRQME